MRDLADGVPLILKMLKNRDLFLGSQILLFGIARSPHIPMDYLEKIGFTEILLKCFKDWCTGGILEAELTCDCLSELLAKEHKAGTP